MPETKRDDGLLPCPFCGREPRIDGWFRNLETPDGLIDRLYPIVFCECGVQANGKNRGGIETAIEVWNKRTPPAPQSQDARELVSLLNDAANHLDACQWPDFARAVREASARLAAPAEKTVPMAMLRELFEYVGDEPEQWGRAEQEDFAMIVRKHMPDYTVKED